MLQNVTVPQGGGSVTTTDRQFVWGPEYVDELVAQLSPVSGGTYAAYYMLVDGNFNVVGMTNSAGAVVEQYTYEPYGTPVAIDDLDPGNHRVRYINHTPLNLMNAG